MAARAVMGLFESGFMPAAQFLCTLWYCRFEYQFRGGLHRRVSVAKGLTFWQWLCFGAQQHWPALSLDFWHTDWRRLTLEAMKVGGGCE